MSETRIGWVGTGVMGISMCGHLMAKGYPTTIYSRTKSRAQSLLDKGAAWADTPGAVAAQSDIIFTIVGLPSDVREVYQKPGGILDAVRERQRHRRHDDHRAEPRARDLRSGQGEGRVRYRCAGVGRRRGCEKRDALDHGRRRQGRGRSRHAALPGDGQEHRPSGRPGQRTAHEDVQSDRAGRHDHRRV